jgi:CheY-like chemotaxis protein
MPRALLVDELVALDADSEKFLDTMPFDIPVIRFSFPGSPQHPTSLPDGVARYLVKPVERSTLLQAIWDLSADVQRLLVVDDDPGMVRFVRRALKSADSPLGQQSIHLDAASSGAQALQRVQHNRPDAVLLDLALPDLSGWDVLKELRAQAIPAILMTAYDYPQMLTHEVRDALRITMHRPLAKDELRAALSALLKSVRPIYPPRPGAVEHQSSPPG